MVDGDVEESLDLLTVQIHGENTIGTRCSQQVSHELGGNRYTRLVFPILAGVSVKGEHGRNPRSRCALSGIDHDQQLHEMLVRGSTGGLDNEDIMTADIFRDLDEGLTVRESCALDMRKRMLQIC